MDEAARGLIERLFEAFNRRDQAGIVAVCDENMEFHAVTAEEVGRTDPYVGPEGLRDYLADVAKVWEELLITAKEVEDKGGCLLVRGRVYLRSRDLGIRDLPASWIWEVHEGRFVSGRAFVDQRLAEEHFAALSGFDQRQPLGETGELEHPSDGG
ncbi:MAG TPA: nuclear transport factor 2 family protein [Solirubrobacterales bacterium]